MPNGNYQHQKISTKGLSEVEGAGGAFYLIIPSSNDESLTFKVKHDTRRLRALTIRIKKRGGRADETKHYSIYG